MTVMMNAKTAEAIQRVNVDAGFAAKVAAILSHGCSSRKNAMRAAAHCSGNFTSQIDIDLPKHLANKFSKLAKINNLTESEFLSGCVRAYAL